MTRSDGTRSGKKANTGKQRLAGILGAVALVILAIYFLLTGSDPLGLFVDLAVTVTPVVESASWWETYFTNPFLQHDPEDLTNSIAENLIAQIDAAEETIHVASFEFDLAPVAEALVAAEKRGVAVRWITDDEFGIDADQEAESSLFEALKNGGVEVRDDARTALMHNKFWIFDGGTVWTGSTNITVNGIFRNNNNVIVIRSPEVGAIYEREFTEMWEGEFGPRSPSTADQQAATIDGTPVRVLFAAEDKVVEQLLPLIEGARRSIRIMAFSFTHDALGAAVLARAARGVDVQAIFERRGSDTEYSEMGNLYCAGVPVRTDGNPRTFHHKVFVLDRTTVITGSFNFSDSADESNDENVVVITDREVAADYLGEFDRRWAEAVAPQEGEFTCK